MAKDPVCGITLDARSPHKSTHAGQIYVFCCSTCKMKFDKEPGRYGAPARVAPLTSGPPSASPAFPYLITSSIGHLFQTVLHHSTSNEVQGRPTWFSARRHSRHAR